MFLVPAHASATPTSSKRQQARRVKAQVEAFDQQVELAAEDFNEAKAKLGQARLKVSRTRARLTKVKARIGVLQASLGNRATFMYRGGRLGMLEVLLGAASFDEFTSTWDLLSEMNRDDAAKVMELKAARAEAQRAQTELVRAQSRAQAQVNLMARKKRSIQRKLAERKRMLSGLEAEVAALQAAEERSAVARAAARRRLYVASRGFDDDFPSPTRAPRGGVVDVATRYLGRPYQWGATGPGSFDCSGFTMFVYSQVGVSLPHSSRSQYGSGEHVSRADLRPGDLVFFGRSRIHHVGIYVGGGTMIHSPHSGDVVRFSSIDRGDYAGAVRP